MAFSIHKILTFFFGSRNERLLKRYGATVAQVNAFEPKIQPMTDEQLRTRTAELRDGLRAGKLRSADVMPEAFAIVRESMDRHIGIRTIFNPEENFDPDKFDDETLELYDSVQRHMIQTGEPWTHVSIPPKIYEAVRKLYPDSRPPFRARCFDVQIIGGLVLSEGKIAEMATGEGKTFVAPLACFMRVLEGMHCQVVTVNDYLVRRDASWVRPAFENLGLTVGFIQADMDAGGEARRKMYECDITYGTNSEFGFDYLRDNMKERANLQVQGPLDFAIVDEVDSILIDEARTPLIISGAAHDDAPKYREADRVARKIMELAKPWTAVEKEVDAAKRAIKAAEGDMDKVKGDKPAIEAIRQRQAEAEVRLAEAEKKKEGLTQYYEVELDRKSVHLSHEGIAAAQDEAGVGSFYVGNNMEWPHLMEQALRAHVVYERDKDYVVERGPRGEMEVVIVDEYTGRKMVGRQWSDGLHQAIEAKEKVPIKQETQTLATVTLQNFFKLYKALAGMTGTAQTEAEEFGKIYRLEVVTIPTNRPVVRQDYEDRVYRTAREKWEAILEEIKEISEKGRPVLVGTTSVEKSETLSMMLKRKYGIEHEVLNAKQHEREAQIVAKAGHQHKNAHDEMVGNVTIATNMAGRGTDIKLTPETTQAGGLHVIGTERHTARRIDNQLRGRGGRQGDPGSSRFYVSLEDELMQMFAGEWTIKVLGWLGMEDGMAIEDKRISKGILRAQKKVEERNFLARKNLLEYDEVMDYQRTQFYGMRQQVLEGQNVGSIIWGMIGEAVADAVRKHIEEDYIAVVVCEWAKQNFDLANLEPSDYRGVRLIADLENFIKSQAHNEVETTVSATLGEYMGEERDEREWDTKGLSSWAMSRFQVNLSQNQIRKMEALEVEEMLKEAAIEQLDKRDCSGLVKYLEPLYAEHELANWAMEKFGVSVDPKEMLADEGRNIRKPAAEIVALIEERARKSYAKREIEYPVDHLLTFTFGGTDGTTDNPYAADYVRAWVRMKFGEELPLEEIRGGSVRRLRDRLIGLQEQFLGDGRLKKEVDSLLQQHETSEELARAFNQRFGTDLVAKDLAALDPVQIAKQRLGKDVTVKCASEGELAAARSGASAGVITSIHVDDVDDVDKDSGPSLRGVLMNEARQFFRKELTDLEQFVLIQIFDQSWKDHLYAMDMLRNSIGLQAFAEKDPRIIYKKEGYRYFGEMMEGIRDKVTDLIFRARIIGAAESRNAYQVTAATHADAGGYGVGENVERFGGQPQPTPGDGGAGEATTTVVKPIVREAAKVGRNDPCPCGSGKKYKKCHGAEAA
jgi:preprotein translocase subunit SecA